MKKILNKIVSFKTIFIILFCVFIISLIPIFMIAEYDLPQDDDFGYSAQTHLVVQAGGNVIDIIKSAIDKSKETYYSWQGTFSAVFLMTLQPGIFGPEFYKITVYVLVFSLVASVFFLFYSLLSGAFLINKYVSLIAATIASALCIQLLPSPVQGIFWYNGAIYYTFFQSLVFLSLAISLRLAKHNHWARIVLLSILSFFIGGGNYSSAIFLAISFIFIAVYLLLTKNKQWKVFIIPFALLLVSLAISISAPGNADRISHSATFSWIFETVLLCFSHCISYMLSWINFVYVGLLLFLVPIFLSALSSCSFSFRLPGLVCILSFCLLASMFSPTIFTLRSDGSSRQIDIYYYTFIVFSVLNVFYFCGWFSAKNKGENVKLGIPLSLFAASSLLVVVFTLISIKFCNTSLTSIISISEIKSGEAKAYYLEASSRYNLLENSSESSVILDPIRHYPILLFERDMTDDPNYYMNQDAATYFNKSSIIVKG